MCECCGRVHSQISPEEQQVWGCGGVLASCKHKQCVSIVEMPRAAMMRQRCRGSRPAHGVDRS
jgi:hypothetical protein